MPPSVTDSHKELPVKSSLRFAVAAAAIAQTVSPLAFADPAAPAEVLEAQLTALVGRTGGLTADHAARRARETSFDVQARAADADVSQAAVDQASAAYAPRIKGTASYQRSSPVAIALGPIGTFQSPRDGGFLAAATASLAAKRPAAAAHPGPSAARKEAEVRVRELRARLAAAR